MEFQPRSKVRVWQNGSGKPMMIVHVQPVLLQRQHQLKMSVCCSGFTRSYHNRPSLGNTVISAVGKYAGFLPEILCQHKENSIYHQWLTTKSLQLHVRAR